MRVSLPRVPTPKISVNPFDGLIRAIPHRTRHRIRWILLHIALLCFLVDTLAVFVPMLHRIWDGSAARVSISLATLSATSSEYFHVEA